MKKPHFFRRSTANEQPYNLNDNLNDNLSRDAKSHAANPVEAGNGSGQSEERELQTINDYSHFSDNLYLGQPRTLGDNIKIPSEFVHAIFETEDEAENAAQYLADNLEIIKPNVQPAQANHLYNEGTFFIRIHERSYPKIAEALNLKTLDKLSEYEPPSSVSSPSM